MDFDRIESDEDEEDEERQPHGCLWAVLKWSLLLLLPLFLGVAALPSALSTDAGRKWALARINRAIAPSAFSCDKWSMGWLSPFTMDRVTFTSPADGLTLVTERAESDAAFGNILPIGRINLGKMTLKRPTCTIGAGGTTAAAPSGGGGGGLFLPIADLAVAVATDDGTFTWAQGKNGGETFTLTHISGSITMSSFWKPLHLDWTAGLGGGILSVKGDVQSLRDWADGKPFTEPRTLALRAEGVDVTALRPLLQLGGSAILPASGLAQGECSLTVKGPKEFAGKADLRIEGFSISTGEGKRSPKGLAVLNGEFGVNETAWTFNHLALVTPWADANADGTLEHKGGGTRTGKLHAEVSVRLPEALRDFADALGLAKGFGAKSGTLRANVDATAGESEWTLAAKLACEKLQLALGKEELALRPEPSLTLNVVFPYGKDEWPEIKALHFKAPFADINGSGRLEQFTVVGSLDLTKFSRDFRRILPACPLMVGSLFVNAGTEKDKDGVTVGALIKIKDLVLELSPGQRTIVPSGNLTAKGVVPLDNNGSAKAELNDGETALKTDDGTAAFAWKRLAWEAGRLTVARGAKADVDMPLGKFGDLIGGFAPAGLQQKLHLAKGRAIIHGTAEISGGIAKMLVNAAGRGIESKRGGDDLKIPDIRVEGRFEQNGTNDDALVEMDITGMGTLSQDGEIVISEQQAKAHIATRFPMDFRRITFKDCTLTSSLGVAKASGTIDDPATVFRVVLTPNTRVLDRVALTQEMVDDLLVPMNPFFQGCRVKSGTMTLDVARFRGDLRFPPERGLDTAFTLTFHNLELVLGPNIQDILALIRVKSNIYKAATLTVPVTVKDGRVTLARTTFILDGGQPVILAGWVDFDGRIRYTIEVPVTAQLAGQTLGSALKGHSIVIPVSGTVDNPVFDTSGLKKSLDSLIGEKNMKKVTDFLDQLRKDLQR